jgi:hypothetical protein
VLFGLELKPSDKIIETTALDMTGDFVGQTVTKVNGLLQEAKGGVLFIDEAYNFDGHFGKEALDTIVAAMTSDEYKDVQIVIAGYPAEIDDMFRTNAGLKSRFTHFFEFPDWTPEDCASFFSKCTQDQKFESLENNVLDAVAKGCVDLIRLEGWANGRDVKRLYDESKSNRAERIHDHPEDARTLLLDDVEPAIATMIQARQPKSRNGRIDEAALSKSALPPAEMMRSPTASNLPPLSQRQETHSEVGTKVNLETHAEVGTKVNLDQGITEEVSEETGCSQESLQVEETETSSEHVNSNDGRDDGVPDEVWDELQACKAREEERQKELARIQEDMENALREEEEAKRRHEAELERIQKEVEREEQERARQEEEEREAQRRYEEEMRRKKIEEQLRKLDEELRRQEEIKSRLRVIGPCPQGFNWHKTGSGWRCGGGTHFVSEAELHSRYGMDA